MHGPRKTAQSSFIELITMKCGHVCRHRCQTSPSTTQHSVAIKLSLPRVTVEMAGPSSACGVWIEPRTCCCLTSQMLDPFISHSMNNELEPFWQMDAIFASSICLPDSN